MSPKKKYITAENERRKKISINGQNYKRKNIFVNERKHDRIESHVLHLAHLFAPLSFNF